MIIPIIDNGHGKDTPGKRSPEWANGNQLHEWEFNRDIARMVFYGMVDNGFAPELLVPEDHDIPLRERINRANEIHKANKSVLVSIHGNATNGNPRPSGLETFYYKAGQPGAEILLDELILALGWKDRGPRKTYQTVKIQQEDGTMKPKVVYKIAITKYTLMPTVLTENGFYTNFEQCMDMQDPDVRKLIANAHVQGLSKWIHGM